MLRPPRVCSTLGVSDRIRVPGPAANTRTAVSPRNVINSPSVLSARERAHRTGLRRQDSNLNYLNQNQRCCRLHHDGLLTTGRWRLIADRAKKTLDAIGADSGAR